MKKFRFFLNILTPTPPRHLSQQWKSSDLWGYFSAPIHSPYQGGQILYLEIEVSWIQDVPPITKWLTQKDGIEWILRMEFNIDAVCCFQKQYALPSMRTVQLQVKIFIFYLSPCRSQTLCEYIHVYNHCSWSIIPILLHSPNSSLQFTGLLTLFRTISMKETGKPVFCNAFSPVNAFCFHFAKLFGYVNFMVEVTPVIF